MVGQPGTPPAGPYRSRTQAEQACVEIRDEWRGWTEPDGYPFDPDSSIYVQELIRA